MSDRPDPAALIAEARKTLGTKYAYGPFPRDLADALEAALEEKTRVEKAWGEEVKHRLRLEDENRRLRG